MIWKNVPGYEHVYEVSDTGLIRNWHTHKILKPRLCKKDGSYLINLNNKGITKTFSVHKLVALVHVHNPNPQYLRFVKHKNGDKLNNDASNLYWTHAKKLIRRAV